MAVGGDPRYVATADRYNGVVSLIMETAAGSFICSGSLLADRQSIVTAAHCVSGGNGTPTPTRTTAYFYGGNDPDLVPSQNALATAVGVSDYFVNAGYTGQVIDENDIAVLRLADVAPTFATSYEPFTGDLTGRDFNVAGFGRRSDAGGSLGANLNSGRRRQGDNKFDFAIGDAAFDGGLEAALRGTATKSRVLLSDFDNGLAANDASCRVSQALGVTDGRFCDLGLGASESMTAGGDAGGPGFVDGRIATVTSFGLTFRQAFGDIDASLNSSFGEIGGYVPVSIHEAFIRRSMVGAVPEPATWAMMMLGIGAVGGALRRRRPTAVSFA